MRKIIPRLLLVTALTITAQAQSGRRNIPTPPADPGPTSPPERERAPVTPMTPIKPPVMSVLPEQLLDREFKSLDSGTFRLADFNGKVLVINLWASWCNPCRMEVPEYEQVRKEYMKRPVEFIALTPEDPRIATDRVRKFVTDIHFGFRMGWADFQSMNILMNGVGTIPQTLVIAADGRIVEHWRGYSPGRNRERLRDAIKSALAGAPQGG